MEEEIKEEFSKVNFVLEDEKEVLMQCLTMCINFKLSASDIVSSWDVYSINRGLGSTVQVAHMGAFLQHLQNERRNSFLKQDNGLHFYSNDISMINAENEDSEEAIHNTPTKVDTMDLSPFDSSHKANKSSFSSKKPLESVTPFGQRKSKFVVQSTLNDLPNTDIIKKELDSENSDDFIRRIQPGKSVSLQIQVSHPAPGCRFMYDKIEDKFNFLENRIEKHANALVASGLCEAPTDPTVASQESVFAVGMICCEEEGRLKEKPILLQSSVKHSGGRCVRLDLQKLSQFSMFPGQVVGIEGSNYSGHCLVASKIVDHVPFSISTEEHHHPAKKQAIDQNYVPTDEQHRLAELSLILAAGPFTTTDNLYFEPLNEILAYAQRKQPQLLILLGPFIDSEHPEIKRGAVNATFDELFQVEILKRLQDYVDYMGSAVHVVLVPSIRDANHDFIFPQPPFNIQLHDLKNQIASLPNPGTFIANGVKLAYCNVDILRQLSGEEISRNPTGGSKQRMAILANHILRQQSFYPLYPPAEGIPLDFSLAPEALQISSIPDILILPSDLAHFVRVLSVDGMTESEQQKKCICVNPGKLARGEGGGFFVELNYHGSPDSASASVIRI